MGGEVVAFEDPQGAKREAQVPAWLSAQWTAVSSLGSFHRVLNLVLSSLPTSDKKEWRPYVFNANSWYGNGARCSCETSPSLCLGVVGAVYVHVPCEQDIGTLVRGPSAKQ